MIRRTLTSSVLLSLLTWIIVFAGCGVKTNSANSALLTTLRNATSQPAITQSTSLTPSIQATTSPAPTALQTGQTIIISYSATQSEQPSVGILDIPKSGYIYEIVLFNITNDGYDSFSTYPFNFYITVNNVEYVYDNATYDLPSPLPNLLVLNGETVNGSLAYQVPIGTTTFKPVYKGPGTFNIQWVAQ
jgi:hypothetical protein